MSSILKVENVTMQFGGVVAVDNLNLEVNKGEIVALIGPTARENHGVQRHHRRLPAYQRGRLVPGGEDCGESPPRQNEGHV